MIGDVGLKRALFVCVGSCLAIALNVNALDYETSLELLAESSYGAQSHYFQKNSLRIDGELDLSINNDLSLTTLVRLQYDNENRLLDGSKELGNYSGVSEPHYYGEHTYLELREVYLDWYFGENYLKLGKQQVVWGETDGLRVLDIINPTDYREMILPDFEDSRIPIWMVNYSRSFSNVNLQFLFIPDTTTSLVGDGLYAPSSPRFVPSITGGFSAISIEDDKGVDTKLGNTDVALKITHSLDGFDLGFIAISQYNDTYVIESNYEVIDDLTTLTLSPKYFRRNLLGFTYSQAFGDLVVRSEAAISDAQYSYLKDNTVNKGLQRSKELSYALALDWSILDDGIITGQFFQSILSSSGKNLTRDKTDSSWSVMLSQYFVNQIYNVDLMFLQNINDRDGLFRAKFNWAYSDALNVSFGGDYFFGDSEGLFGQFESNDRVYFTVEYTH